MMRRRPSSSGSPAQSGSVLSAVNQGLMILFLTYFMLLSDQLFKRKLGVIRAICDGVEDLQPIGRLPGDLTDPGSTGKCEQTSLTHRAVLEFVPSVLNSA